MAEIWQKGEIITFGHYPQSHSSANEPIEWRILRVDGDQALLTSLYALDAQPFHLAQDQHDEENNAANRPLFPRMTDYADSSLRVWLNDAFFKAAFSAQEQNCIAETEDLKDKVSLLTLDEINDADLFSSDASTGCKPTAYAASLYTDDIEADRQERATRPLPPRASYWLKNRGIVIHGDAMEGVMGVTCMRLALGEKLAVRPALRLDLAQYERLLKGDSFFSHLLPLVKPIAHRFDEENKGSIQVDKNKKMLVADGIGYPDLHLEMPLADTLQRPDALTMCLAAAISGDAMAQNAIGSLLWFGNELAQSYEEAFRWNRYAANQGLPEAMVDLADAYGNAKGVEANPELAFSYSLKAAQKDFPLGMLNTGKCYAYGMGTEQNVQEAICWLEKALASGMTDASELLDFLKMAASMTDPHELLERLKRR